MKHYFLVLVALLALSACSDILPPNPITATNTCVVKDSSGRIWRWSAAGNACKKAVFDCQRWHLDHPGFGNSRCIIVEGDELNHLASQ